MSQENVETVRRGYERLAELRSPDLAFLDSEVEWYGPREFPDLAEPHYGHDGVRRYIEKVNEAFDDYRMVPEEFVDAGGDQVLVFSREGGRGWAAGQVADQCHRPPRTLRDGKAVRMQSYSDRAEALEAAGLSR